MTRRAAIDRFSEDLFEEAKRFLEKAASETTTAGRAAYLHAALNLGFCALEAHINSITSDFELREDLNVLERSILFERDFELRDGAFHLTQRLKIYRPEDRLQYICHKFAGKPVDRRAVWWCRLNAGLALRNKVTHPKGFTEITVDDVRRSLEAVLQAIDKLYRAVYKRGYPALKRGLQSTLDF